MHDNIISPHNWLFDYREYEILRLYQMIELESSPFIEKAHCCGRNRRCFVSYLYVESKKYN